MDKTRVVRAEALNPGDVMVLGPRRVPVISAVTQDGKVLVEKCTASAYPLVYEWGELVTILHRD